MCVHVYVCMCVSLQKSRVPWNLLRTIRFLDVLFQISFIIIFASCQTTSPDLVNIN